MIYMATNICAVVEASKTDSPHTGYLLRILTFCQASADLLKNEGRDLSLLYESTAPHIPHLHTNRPPIWLIGRALARVQAADSGETLNATGSYETGSCHPSVG